MKTIIKKVTRSLGFDIVRYNKPPEKIKMATLQPENGSKGNVLLAYILDPFLLEPGESVSNKHTHDWESLQMGRTFQELGYTVDVIDYREKDFIPKKEYAFFVSARSYFAEISSRLNPDCIKIVHLETSHFLFNNTTDYIRHLDLQQRRGITLVGSRKLIRPNWGIEHADIAVIKGNQFTADTYAYAGKPTFHVSNPSVLSLPWPEKKPFDSCRKNFLWFGSDGLVHKGLDLVLEAFVDMPDHHLTVCGPVREDKDFAKAFQKELFETPNIHTYGWVDIESRDFINIVNNCIGMVYPSCAEAQAGSVVNCLRAGLIPIVSYETGVDVHDFGIIMKKCTINEIKDTVQTISKYPADKLEKMARGAWEHGRDHHSREKYAENYKSIILDIIANYNKKIPF